MDLKIKKIFLSSEFFKESENDGENSGNTDVVVTLDNGKKFIASFFSYKYLNKINHEHIKSGEYLRGNYFWDKNMVLVKDCSNKTIKPVVINLMDEGNFEEAFMEL